MAHSPPPPPPHADDGDGDDLKQQEAEQPDPKQEKSILQQHIDLANTPTLPADGGRSHLQELITSGDLTGRLHYRADSGEPHVLQWGDLNLDGDGGLDYLTA